MTVYELLKWAIVNRVVVTFDKKDGCGRYMVDGRLFRAGTYRMIFKNDKYVRRTRVNILDWEAKEVKEHLWLDFKRFGHSQYTSRPHWETMAKFVTTTDNRRLSYAELRNIR